MKQDFNSDNKQDVVSRIKKVLIKIAIIVLCIFAVVVLGFGIIVYRGLHPKATQTSAEESIGEAQEDTDVINQDDGEKEYIDTPFYDEKVTYAAKPIGIPIMLSDDAYRTLSESLKQQAPFNFAKYYALEEALDLYASTPVEKSKETTLLTNGLLDADKLYQNVLSNNHAVIVNGKNTLNIFYSEADSSEMVRLCEEIADVINHTSEIHDIEAVANTLEKLTIFKREGTTNNAYVSTELSLVYNPNTINMYKTMQGVTDGSSELAWEQVIDHEIMHLIQYGASDHIYENGIETGFCRMYNTPDSEKKIPVDSLYFSWLLEAGAELGMADYLEVEPYTYQKKRSYVTSYNLSQFYENGMEESALENVIFKHTLEEVFVDLGLEAEEEKKAFLDFMYSIEITQSDEEDFWEYYESQTGKVLTEDEKLSIRMDIRTYAVRFLTTTFLENLIAAVHEGAITDLDTAFYMMRLWELDTFNHLNYTEISSFEQEKDFIGWYNEMQNAILTAIAESSKLDPNEMQALYAEYYLQLKSESDEVRDNCDLSGMNDYMKNYILSARQSYATSKYSRIYDVAKWETE